MLCCKIIYNSHDLNFSNLYLSRWPFTFALFRQRRTHLSNICWMKNMYVLPLPFKKSSMYNLAASNAVNNNRLEEISNLISKDPFYAHPNSQMPRELWQFGNIGNRTCQPRHLLFQQMAETVNPYFCEHPTRTFGRADSWAACRSIPVSYVKRYFLMNASFMFQDFWAVEHSILGHRKTKSDSTRWNKQRKSNSLVWCSRQ